MLKARICKPRVIGNRYQAQYGVRTVFQTNHPAVALLPNQVGLVLNIVVVADPPF